MKHTIDNIYEVFYDKLPDSLECVLPVYDRCKIVTCLNPYYMIKLQESDYPLYNNFDYIASDGIGPILLNTLLRKSKSIRLSFDMSSMAGPVFRDIIAHGEQLYILGAKPGEVERSVETIRQSFRNIKIAGFHHGYINDCKEQVIAGILHSRAKVVIIGMGAPLQDEMAVALKKLGFIGTIYTCGGFIHQTQNNIISFPEWSNKLRLRWLYRIFTQKGMIKRLIETYPKFVITYSFFLLKKQKNQ